MACSRVNHTARNGVLLQKLTITQKVKKFTACYGNRTSIPPLQLTSEPPIAPHSTPLEFSPHPQTVLLEVPSILALTQGYPKWSFQFCFGAYIFCARFASLPLYHTCANLHLNTASRDQQNPTTFLFYVHARACRHYSNHLWDCVRSINVSCVVPIWGLIKHNFIACRNVCIRKLKFHRLCCGDSQNNCYIAFQVARWWRSIL